MLRNLEEHFEGEEDGESVVDVAEDGVADAGGVDRVLGGQRDAAGADDDHDERVERVRRHHAVDVATRAARANTDRTTLYLDSSNTVNRPVGRIFCALYSDAF